MSEAEVEQMSSSAAAPNQDDQSNPCVLQTLIDEFTTKYLRADDGGKITTGIHLALLGTAGIVARSIAADRDNEMYSIIIAGGVSFLIGLPILIGGATSQAQHDNWEYVNRNPVNVNEETIPRKSNTTDDIEFDKSYVFAQGKIIVPTFGVFLQTSEDTKSGRIPKPKGSVFRLKGETRNYWIVNYYGKTYCVSKTWAKKLVDLANSVYAPAFGIQTSFNFVEDKGLELSKRTGKSNEL